MKKAEPMTDHRRGGKASAQVRAVLDELLNQSAGEWFDVTEDLTEVASRQQVYTMLYCEAGKRLIEVKTTGGGTYARNLVDRTP